MKIRYPDYDRSLLSVVSSVTAHFGAGAMHKTLPELVAELARGYKNVVLMLFDGMGTAILERYLPLESFLRRHMTETISTVFPPTTTAATTAALTGLSSIEHGWLGWSLYFKEIGANVSIFPNTISGSGGAPAADYHVGLRYLPFRRVIERINDAGQARAYTVSPFAELTVYNVRGICDTVEHLCAGDGRKYIYTYWTQPDEDMHNFGTSHENVSLHMQQINDEVGRLCGRLSDTLVIVTADHGMTDVTWRFLPEYPAVTRCLARTPWMEPRATAFAVKPGCEREFERAFEQAFGDCFILFSRQSALEQGLFGPGEPHPRAESLLGDYIAAATGNVALEVRERTDDVLRAHHAGLTADEMNIPLIIART
jgi:hypothetical protein